MAPHHVSSVSVAGAESLPEDRISNPRNLRLAGKHAAMVVFSPYPADPRPRRAAEALAQEGMSVDLISQGWENLPKREKLGNLDVTRIPIRRYRGGVISYALQYGSFITLSAASLAWRMLRKRYDLVYVHNMPDILVISALLPKLFGAKVIMDQHDPMPELMMTIFGKEKNNLAVRILRHLEKWSFARADLVITVNEACRRIFSSRSCAAEKIAVIMNSPDEETFPWRGAKSYALPPSDAPFVIMYHGSIFERNGLSLAVEAFAQVVKAVPNSELRVYGRSTPYLEQVMQKVKALGLEEHVHYFGVKKWEELAREIGKCNVGVIPNQRNLFTDINTPTRIFEYLAVGKPVIAPRTAGIRDYFEGDSLVFFESGDAADLAKAMMFVALHPVEAREVAERGQEVYRKHSWATEKEALVSLVEALVENQSAG